MMSMKSKAVAGFLVVIVLSIGALFVSCTPSGKLFTRRSLAGVPKNFMVSGYDVSLRLEEFKGRYPDKIAKCDSSLYSSDSIPGQSVPIEKCELKDGAMAAFYMGELYVLVTGIEQAEVPFKVAAEALTQKVGAPWHLETLISDMFTTRCGAVADVGETQVIVMSRNAFRDVIAAATRRGDQRYNCTPEMLDHLTAEYARYSVPSTFKVMERQLLNQQKKNLQDAASKVNL